MLTIYLGTKILVFKHFAESHQSTSNLAKISLSNGVPLLVLQKLISTTGWRSAQYVAFSCLLLVYFGLLDDFKDDLDEKNSKHFDRSLFFGSFSFCLSFWKMFLSRTLLMITFGYFYPLVYAMG
jgi:hypothetical protein